MKPMKTLPWLGLKSLSQLMYATVRITTKDGRVVEGEAVSFSDFVESETGHELIGLQMDGYIDGFDETMIKDIVIVKPPDFDPFT